MTESSNTPLTAISLVGYQGSGKSTLAKKLARSIGTVYVETSDVVKDLTGVEKREELPETTILTKDNPSWLTGELANRLKQGAIEQNSRYAVLCGVRESSVHSSLLRRKFGLIIFEVTASPITRYQRVKALSKVRSIDEFLEHELRERDMGLPKILSKAQYKIETSTDTDPDQLVAIIKKRVMHVQDRTD